MFVRGVLVLVDPDLPATQGRSDALAAGGCDRSAAQADQPRQEAAV